MKEYMVTGKKGVEIAARNARKLGVEHKIVKFQRILWNNSG